MSEPHHTIAPPARSGVISFLRRKLPYVAVLALAVFGVAYSNISHQPLNGYWEFMAVAIGFLCVATGWQRAPDREARIRLMWMQAAHWVTFLVTMNLVLLPSFQRLLPAPATSLVLLMLLALGTFLAGINLLSLQICFLVLPWHFRCQRSHGSSNLPSFCCWQGCLSSELASPFGHVEAKTK